MTGWILFGIWTAIWWGMAIAILIEPATITHGWSDKIPEAGLCICPFWILGCAVLTEVYL